METEMESLKYTDNFLMFEIWHIAYRGFQHEIIKNGWNFETTLINFPSHSKKLFNYFKISYRPTFYSSSFFNHVKPGSASYTFFFLM